MSIYENWLSKIKFFWLQIFFGIFDFINGYKNEFQDNNGKFAGDPKIGFLTKSILKPYDRAAAMPTAWELTKN